jgi:hypothetical protein
VFDKFVEIAKIVKIANIVKMLKMLSLLNSQKIIVVHSKSTIVQIIIEKILRQKMLKFYIGKC